jgi:HK97 family phage portal protein
VSLFFGRGEKRAMDWWGAGEPRPGTVTESNASHLAPVFAALRHIVDFTSTLPVDTFRTNTDGSRSPMSTLPLLLRSQNAPGRPGLAQWLGQAAYGLAAHGNAVGWIVETDGFGYPTVVRWLKRSDWSFDETTAMFSVGGRPVSSSNLVHIPWIVPTGHTLGMSPIEHYASIVRAGLSAQEYADVKRGGGLPPSVLKNTRLELDHDQSTRIRERAAAAFATGKPFVTGADWDLTLMTIPPNHAQFIETLKLSANQIAAIYGIDPREIGGSASESLTYSNDESRSLNRANNMRPYIVRLEDAFNRLLPERQFVKLNVDATIRTDIKTRIEVIGAQVADGLLSVNEARALEDRPGIGSAGDRYNVPAPKAEPTQRKEAP